MEETIQLPAPRTTGRMSVEAAIAARRSRRAYKGDPVKLAEAGQLLWAAQGVTGAEGQRAAPSAGALYPLKIYLSATRVAGLDPGVYKYNPDDHQLALHAPGDVRSRLTASVDQDCIRFSACVVAFAGVPDRLRERFGERAAGLLQMEAAHASENVYLQAAALGLGTVAVASFRPAEVGGILGLPEGEVLVYLMPVGRV